MVEGVGRAEMTVGTWIMDSKEVGEKASGVESSDAERKWDAEGTDDGAGEEMGKEEVKGILGTEVMVVSSPDASEVEWVGAAVTAGEARVTADNSEMAGEASIVGLAVGASVVRFMKEKSRVRVVGSAAGEMSDSSERGGRKLRNPVGYEEFAVTNVDETRLVVFAEVVKIEELWAVELRNAGIESETVDVESIFTESGDMVVEIADVAVKVEGSFAPLMVVAVPLLEVVGAGKAEVIL